MIILGVLLIILGYVVSIGILEAVGALLVLFGVVFAFFPVGGRRFY